MRDQRGVLAEVEWVRINDLVRKRKEIEDGWIDRKKKEKGTQG